MNILESANALGSRYVALVPLAQLNKAALDQLPASAVIVDIAAQDQRQQRTMRLPVSQGLAAVVSPTDNAGLALAVQLGLQGARDPQKEAAVRLASKPPGSAFQAKRGPRPRD